MAIRSSLLPASARRALVAPSALALGLVALLCACTSPSVTPVEKKLSARPEALDFPRSFIGYPTIEEVRIVNAARGDDAFHVFELESPFLVKPVGDVKIRGSGTVTLKVQFSPPAVGSYEGTLRIRLGEERIVEIPLSGRGEQPLACPSSPCADARFDPRAGACVVEPRIDGARCESSNQCLVDTTCQGGRCVGAARVCEPPSACFRSVCNPDVGCEDIPNDGCEQPENPCRVARCDAARGCVEEDREDFSPCGPVTCQEQNICLGGSCVTIDEVDDGTPCLHACGAGGACEGGICKRPGGDRLEPSWRLGVGAQTSAAVDAAGYVYWLECEDAGCHLASATPDRGFARFRAAIAPALGRAAGLLLSDEEAIVWGEGGIEAFVGLGQRKWLRPVIELLGGDVGEPSDPPARLLQVVDAGEGRLVARALVHGSELMLGLSAADGSLDWIQGAPVSAIVSDGEGRIYAIDRAGESLELSAYARDGEPLWGVEVPEETRLLAALPSRLFLASEGRLEARLPTNGEPVWTRPFEPLDLVLSASQAFAIEEGPAGPRLLALDVDDGEAKGPGFPLEGAGERSTLALIAEDRAVLLRELSEPAPGWWLEAFGPEGERAFACGIPDATPARPWVFTVGGEGPRLVVITRAGEVRSFVAPKLARPPYGWSAEEGSFARGGRPRQ